MKKTCIKCQKEFDSKFEEAKFCSHLCYSSSRIGKPRSAETVRKMVIGRKKWLQNNPLPKGEKHQNWKGGTYICKDGYRMVRHGKWYIKEHRLKMEQKIGRKLTKSEVVHHWDENRLNNDLENLCLFRSQAAHRTVHGFAEKHGLKVSQLKFTQPWL